MSPNEFQELEPIAAALNAESNEINSIIAALNAKLAAFLNVGLEVWLLQTRTTSRSATRRRRNRGNWQPNGTRTSDGSPMSDSTTAGTGSRFPARTMK